MTALGMLGARVRLLALLLLAFGTARAPHDGAFDRLPPLALLATVFAAFVLIVRLSELFGPSAARAVTKLSFLAASAFTVWLFL